MILLKNYFIEKSNFSDYKMTFNLKKLITRGWLQNHIQFNTHTKMRVRTKGRAESLRILLRDMRVY